MKVLRATCDSHRYFLCICFCRQDSWYEFRVMAVMVDLISESSNVVGVSSTGWLLCKKKKRAENDGCRGL